MSEDRYEGIARNLRYIGWFQDLVLRRARTHIVEVLRARGAESVLDAGCGSGTLSKYLKNSGFNVTGVDSSKAMLDLARRKVQGVTFVQDDMTTMSFEQQADGAVVALSLHEMCEETRFAFWEAMRKATSRGGVLILLDFIPLENPNSISRLVQRLIWKDEKNIGRQFDPDHFENFQKFMNIGGAKTWLLNRRESIVEERHFLFGNLGVYVTVA